MPSKRETFLDKLFLVLLRRARSKKDTPLASFNVVGIRELVYKTPLLRDWGNGNGAHGETNGELATENDTRIGI